MNKEKHKSILKWIDSSEATEPLSYGDGDRNVHFRKEVRVKKYKPAGRPNDIKKKHSIVNSLTEDELFTEPRISIESRGSTQSHETFESHDISPEETESFSQQVSYRDNIQEKDTLNLRRGTAFPAEIRAQLATMDEEDDTYIESDSEMTPTPRKPKEQAPTDDRSIISGSFPIESYNRTSFDDSSLITGTLLDSEFEPIHELESVTQSSVQTSDTEIEPISAGDDSTLRRYLERTDPNLEQSNQEKPKTKPGFGARKASLFPTVDNIPISRPQNEYGRKKSIADFTKDVYNQKRSDVIEKGAIPMSQRRLSQMVNMVLWKEKNSDAEITHTVHVFPNYRFIDVLTKIKLDVQIYFEDGEPITRSTSYTAADHATINFVNSDYGEPDRVIVRINEDDDQTKIKWQLDCVTVKSGGYPCGLFPSFEWLSPDSTEVFLNRGVRYHISIASGSSLNSSSKIAIKIVGDQGLKTSWHELVHSETNSKPFQKNKNDIFMLGDTDIGYPYKIYFKIDSKSKSKWFVNYVKVSVCRSKESQYDDWDNSLIFTGNKWMINKKCTNFIYTDERQRKIDKKREKSARRKCTLDHKCTEHHGQCDDNTCSSAHYSILS